MKATKNLVTLILFLLTVQFVQGQSLSFEKGSRTAQFGFGLGATFATGSVTMPPIQFRYEKAITDKISVGGILGYSSSKFKYEDVDYIGGNIVYKESAIKYSYLLIGARGNYHFETGEKLDPYVGATLGYNKIGVGDTGYTGSDVAVSGILLGAQIGANYYFSDKIGAWAELGYGISYLNVGLAYKF